jgi:hypothetical protein
LLSLINNLSGDYVYGKEYQLPLKFNAWVEQDDSNTVMYSLEQERGEYLICAGTWRAIVTPPWWKRSSHITVKKRYSPVFLLFVLVTLFTGGVEPVDKHEAVTLMTNKPHYQSVLNIPAVLAEKGGSAVIHGGDMTLAFHRDKIALQDGHSCNHVPTACFRAKMKAMGLVVYAFSWAVAINNQHYTQIGI